MEQLTQNIYAISRPADYENFYHGKSRDSMSIGSAEEFCEKCKESYFNFNRKSAPWHVQISKGKLSCKADFIWLDEPVPLMTMDSVNTINSATPNACLGFHPIRIGFDYEAREAVEVDKDYGDIVQPLLKENILFDPIKNEHLILIPGCSNTCPTNIYDIPNNDLEIIVKDTPNLPFFSINYMPAIFVTEKGRALLSSLNCKNYSLKKFCLTLG